jgi:hypothetical protein
MSNLLTLAAADLLLSADAPASFAEQMADPGDGRALVAFTGDDHRLNTELSLGLLSALGTVLSVYPAEGCWGNLEVRTDADPGRTHGTGENRLHVDLVDREQIPRFIALYCQRADPAEGGASALADLHAAAAELTAAEQGVLRQPAFSYWADQGVHGTGESLPVFPVLPPAIGPGAPVRFTSKMEPHLQRGDLACSDNASGAEIAAAFRSFVRAVYRHRTTVRLLPGQLLVFDQLRWAHGRMPLGKGQAAILPARRRLLVQAYVRGGGR